jgi:hypothetical protein
MPPQTRREAVSSLGLERPRAGSISHQPSRRFGNYTPIQVNPGQTKVINVSITPSAAPGTTVNGVMHVDDDYLYSPFLGSDAGGDQLASIPYSYVVGS